MGAYASYVFEVIFAFLIWSIFRPNLALRFSPDKSLGYAGVIALATGFGIYKLAAYASIDIPFDLSENETILFLLLIGPVVEELVFRMALWEPLSNLLPRTSLVILISSAIFSFAHFVAWWHVPESLRAFVLYQTTYTFLLGLYCGWLRAKYGSILSNILFHALFNLAFFVGAHV